MESSAEARIPQFRYGTARMHALWSEPQKRMLWRRVWVALAEAQAQHGIVTDQQLADLRAHENEVDLQRALQLEATIKHDLMAELRVFAEQCEVGGAILHLGATSMDIEDNADALRMKDAIEYVLDKLKTLLLLIAERIDRWAETPALGYTHLQAAEPTTVGYRLALYGQDLLLDYEQLRMVLASLRGKGLKGAVGTSAPFAELLSSANGQSRSTSGTVNDSDPAVLEARFLKTLGIQAFSVCGQTYPRKQDWFILSALAGLSASLAKFAFDLRILQSYGFQEWFEPTGEFQVHSSAMPFKRNPVNAEVISSLARLVIAACRVAWDNAANSLLERTLDDSRNRDEILGSSFCVTDEILERAIYIFQGLEINLPAVEQNLARHNTRGASERLLLAGVLAGGDRQVLHERLRSYIQAAQEADAPGGLSDYAARDPYISRLLTREEIEKLDNISGYVGDAPSRARELARLIHASVDPPPNNG